MDWTSLTGSPSPLEPRVLRLLILIDQLGDNVDTGPSEETAGAANVVIRELTGEWTVLQLDYLVSHLDQLAYLLIDRFDRSQRAANERGNLVRHIRQLRQMQAPGKRGRRQHLRHQHLVIADPPSPGPWRRLDDVLADASSRGLLRVELTAENQLAYGLRRRAAELIDAHRHEGEVAHLLEVCDVLREFFPHADGDWFEHQLEDMAQSLQELRLEQPMGLEGDPLSTIFTNTFGQQL